MSKARRRLALYFGVVAFFLYTAVAVAQDDAAPQDAAPKKVETEAEKLVREFDEFAAQIDKEIARREEHTERGESVLKTYRQQLTAEYQENTVKLSQSLAGHLAPIDQHSLKERQKVIALHLWELERLEPLLEAKVIPTDDLQEKVRNQMMVLQRARRVGKSAGELNQRCQELQQKVFELEHRRHNNPAARMREMYDGFYEVQPKLDATIGNQRDAAAGPFEPSKHSGALPGIRSPLRRMLKLSWRGKSLSLDRDHWNDLFAGKTLADVADEVRRAFEDRGVELFSDSEHLRGRRTTLDLPNVCLLFQNLQYSATKGQGGPRGTSRSGGGGQWQQSFETGQLHAMLASHDDVIDLDIKEKKSPYRSLRIFSQSDDSLRISLLGERMLYIEQRGDGRVRLLEVYRDEMLHATGDSFLDVYSKHPDFVEASLLPSLDELGFVVPATRYSPQVAGRVVQLARIMQSNRAETFDRLVKNLDSPSYSTREMAGLELEKQLDSYADLVRDAYQDQGLSIEVRARLKRVLHLDEKGPRQLDEFIAGMNMLNDPRYLVNLLPKLADHEIPIITARLEQLTGEPLGTDVEAWQVWLQQS